MKGQVNDENSPLLQKHESEPSASSSPSTSYYKKLKYILSNISVEPILFLHAVSYSVESLFKTNMIIDKTCNILMNYSKEVCDHLDSGDYDAEQDAVQRITNKYEMYNNWIEFGPAIFVMIFLGTWSDVRGRRLPLVIPMIGSTLKALLLLVNAYFWYWQPYFIVLSYIPYGLGGSSMAIYMAAYAYIGNHSGDRSRTARLSIAGLMMYAASPIGHYSGTLIYMHGGYVFVFGTELILSTLSVIYGIVRFKPGPSKTRKGEVEKSPGEKKITLATIKASVMVVIKPREGKQRAHLLSHIFCIWITMSSMEGMSFMYLYTRKRFDWNYYSYTIFSIVQTPVSFVASCILLPLLSYHFQIEDSMLGFIGSASHIFFGIIVGTAPFAWVLYLALVASSCSGMIMTSSRGALSKLVASYELGGIFSIVALGEAVIPIIAKPIFTLIYNSTLEIFPGTVFIVGSLVGIIVSCLYTWILTNGNVKAIKVPEP